MSKFVRPSSTRCVLTSKPENRVEMPNCIHGRKDGHDDLPWCEAS